MYLMCGPSSLDTHSRNSLSKISSIISSEKMAQNQDADSINLTVLCAHSYPIDLHLRKGILLWAWVFV